MEKVYGRKEHAIRPPLDDRSLHLVGPIGFGACPKSRLTGKGAQKNKRKGIVAVRDSFPTLAFGFAFGRYVKLATKCHFVFP
jgi:hypothetical protein